MAKPGDLAPMTGPPPMRWRLPEDVIDDAVLVVAELLDGSSHSTPATPARFGHAGTSPTTRPH